MTASSSHLPYRTAMGSKNRGNFANATHKQALHYTQKEVKGGNILHIQGGDKGAQVLRGGSWTTEFILNEQEGEEAHKEMEEGKPAGSDKCTRVKSNGYTMRVRRSYIEYKGKEAYKRIDCPTSLSATCPTSSWALMPPSCCRINNLRDRRGSIHTEKCKYGECTHGEMYVREVVRVHTWNSTH